MSADESIPMTLQVADDADTVGFEYRFINTGDGHVDITLGDRFELSPAFTGDGAELGQIGLDLCIKGMHFLGIASQDRQLLAQLILRYMNDVTLEESGG